MRDKPTKVIAYCRVGSAVQAQDDKAYEAQKFRLNKYAAESNFEIVAWFELLGYATNSLEDTGLQEAHDYCVNNPDVKYLIATEPSRISRSLEGLKWWKESFNAHGVKLRFTDLNDEDFLMHLIVMAARDSHYRGQLSARAKKAQ